MATTAKRPRKPAKNTVRETASTTAEHSRITVRRLVRYALIGGWLLLVPAFAVCLFLFSDPEHWSASLFGLLLGFGYALIFGMVFVYGALDGWPRLRQLLFLAVAVLWFFSAAPIVLLCALGSWLGFLGLFIYVVFFVRFRPQIFGNLSHHDVHVIHHVMTHRH